MSRAFVKEPDGDQVADDQPEWPISPHTNYVTAYGLNQLKNRLDTVLKHINELRLDKENMGSKIDLPQQERELRYLNARVDSAKLINITNINQAIVSIGATVKVIDEDDMCYEFTIVGEDEADIKSGKISWVSPLAKALLDHDLGDSVVWKRPMGDLHIEIDEIIYA